MIKLFTKVKCSAYYRKNQDGVYINMEIKNGIIFDKKIIDSSDDIKAIAYIRNPEIKCDNKGRILDIEDNWKHIEEKEGNTMKRNNGYMTPSKTRKTSETYTCAGCGKKILANQAYCYVDPNNFAITNNSKAYCRECYRIKYGE